MDKPPVWIGFTSASGLLGQAIRWASDATVSHAFLAWRDSNFESIMTLGANANGVTLQPLSRMALDTPTLWQGPLDLWQGIIANADLINLPYGWVELFGMSIIEAERHLFLRHSSPANQAAIICSAYVCEVMRSAGYSVLDSMSARTIDPGQIYDWIRAAGFQPIVSTPTPKLSPS